jgi:ferredoxin-NADP reductase
MHHVTFLRQETVAEGTSRFYFQKPEGFTFTAGQAVDITLIDPAETDAEGNTRTYSLCSAPEESELSLATRMRDTAFKRTLAGLPAGSEVVLDGPTGSFFLHENTARGAVFLAGGIGITPFRSIVLDAVARNLPHQMFLFYSNRRPEDAPFLAELQTLAASHTNLTFVPTMTNMEHSTVPWSGERGYIDAPMLERYVAREAPHIYYLAGPQAMVTAMRQLLVGMGISSDDIRFEEFSGY